MFEFDKLSNVKIYSVFEQQWFESFWAAILVLRSSTLWAYLTSEHNSKTYIMIKKCDVTK